VAIFTAEGAESAEGEAVGFALGPAVDGDIDGMDWVDGMDPMDAMDAVDAHPAARTRRTTGMTRRA